MSFYNMLFGMNWQSDILLAVIGLKKCDVERFRDARASEDGTQILVYTRTGGGNRNDYSNLTLRKAPGWLGSEDDDFDSTYCTDTFAVPARFVADVKALNNPLENGLRRAFVKHIAKTLMREPTEADRLATAYETERNTLERTNHFMANGHTFVPMDDGAMETALKLAEANGGSLISAWGILPITITVQRDFVKYPNATDENTRANMIRVEVNYDFRWSIDVAYWEHCKERFTSKYPITMTKIANDVQTYIGRQRVA